MTNRKIQIAGALLLLLVLWHFTSKGATVPNRSRVSNRRTEKLDLRPQTPSRSGSQAPGPQSSNYQVDRSSSWLTNTESMKPQSLGDNLNQFIANNGSTQRETQTTFNTSNHREEINQDLTATISHRPWLPSDSESAIDMVLMPIPPMRESIADENTVTSSSQITDLPNQNAELAESIENDSTSREFVVEEFQTELAEDSGLDLIADDKVQQTATWTPQGPSNSTQVTTDYRLAGQPKVGDRYKSETPTFDRLACETEACFNDFSPDPIDPFYPYDPYLNQQVYEGKQLNANQRPLLELGRPWYQLGQLPEGYSFLGHHNSINPQFLIFGDFRSAIASNTVNDDSTSQVAFEFNTFWSFFITGTERLVTGVTPLDKGGRNTRWLLDDDFFDTETDFDFDFGYLEGDLGAIVGGFTRETLPFDLPFAVGLTPLFIQNGIWLNDAVEGLFITRAAQNSPRLNISNMDITFAYIWDQIDSAAFEGDNSAARAYAFFTFIEALNGYIEFDYAFVEDRTDYERSYHNIGVAYSRRFGRFISHSTRVIANAGQDPVGRQTADGVLLLSENSLITRSPYTVVPYANFFAGFDTPQSFAGDNELLNTGILFESDGMTGYPTLDTNAADTFGYALGLNLIAQDFSQQLILETAAVFRNDDSNLAGDQYGVGMRYQIPLSNSWIFRTDAMYGFFRNDYDDHGVRMELRKKF
ncbi:MAG: hypothetical protein AAGA30_06175 [Planctomycetota bacterium]